MTEPIMHFGTTAVCGSSDKLTTKFKVSFKSWQNKCLICECLLIANKK